MVQKSRTEYSARNTSVAVISRIVAIVMGYVTRVVFTHQLSEAYVGVSGLFTDILNVLAMSELGVGTAITFALYKPIATGDIEKQKSLMKLFQRMYLGVALLIVSVGLLLIPFLPLMMRGSQEVDHVVIIYLLYLSNTAVSYLFVYKKTLVDAHQLSYIGVMYNTIFLVIQDVLQIVVLITTQNFILFLVIFLSCTIGNNLLIAWKADRMYPFLKEKNTIPLEKKEEKEIVKNIKAMLMHKIGSVIVNNTDNILIFCMIGIRSAGVYANNYLIIGSVRQLLDQAFQGITASVGNLGATESSRDIKKIFETGFFIGQWMYGFAAICLFELLSPFAWISFGENYAFAKEIVFVLAANFYVTGMRQATIVFRDSMGLFWYDRYKAPIEAIINLVASVILTLKFGIVGVFLGTFVSTMLTSFWVEPMVLYHIRLKESMRGYFRRYFYFVLLVLAAGAATDWVCSRITSDIWMIFLLRIPVCVVVPNLIYLMGCCHLWEFRFAWQKLMRLFHRSGAEKELNYTEQERALLTLTKSSLTRDTDESQEETFLEKWTSGDWGALITIADRHAILPFFYEHLTARKEWNISEDERSYLTQKTRQIVMQSYNLLYDTWRIQTRLSEAGISTVVLKGMATASMYPVPQIRKSGDIDLLILDTDRVEEAVWILHGCGYREEANQKALHHVAMYGPGGIEVELHTMLAEPFDNERINRYLQQCLSELPRHTVRRNVLGYEICMLKDGYHAYGLLLHMLQHFLRSGFGLKLLCDWVVFWNREVEPEEIQVYRRLVRESRLSGFSDMVSAACVQQLGLKEAYAPWIFESEITEGGKAERPKKEQTVLFLKEILRAEEFGKSSSKRMVVTRGDGLGDYFREFHHQTCLNFPKSSKVFLFWPLLWMITLARFLHNNRVVRGVSAREIFREAGRRSEIIKYIDLFQK